MLNKKKNGTRFTVTDHCLGLMGLALCASLSLPAFSQEFGVDEDSSSLNGGEVRVSPYLTVDIHVQDTELATVLRMLSVQSQKNIIASSGVSAMVTADLYDVTFYEALDAILHANGYGYIEEGNFIHIYTADEIQTIKDAQRVVVPRVFQLSYLSAADASVFVSQLLSDNGSIAVSGEVVPGFDADMSDGGSDSFALASTLVVTDYEENIGEIAILLDQLDTRPKQVLVESTVLQTTLGEDNAFGLDFNIIADMNFLDIADPRSVVDALLGGSGAGGYQPDDNNGWGVQSDVGRTTAAGGLKVGIVSEDISVFLRVLDEVTDTTVLSRPQVLALNRNRGEILIGRRLGYLSTTATETSTTQTVEFLDTGTKLNFRPFISKDGYIRMELRPSVSEGIIREVTTSDGQVMTIPDEITQELTTNVIVRDGHTIVLGGLFKEETTLSRRQVPFLGDMPLLGNAFKGYDDSTERSEIIFLITPTIMQDEVLVQNGEEASQYIEMARLGARNGVLPWSNDKLTSQHNMRAEQYLREGDTEMALWEISQSLSLNPNQPLVNDLREKITGERERAYNRSILEELMNEHIESASGLSDQPNVSEELSEYNAPESVTCAEDVYSAYPEAESMVLVEDSMGDYEPDLSCETDSYPTEETPYIETDYSDQSEGFNSVPADTTGASATETSHDEQAYSCETEVYEYDTFAQQPAFSQNGEYETYQANEESYFDTSEAEDEYAEAEQYVAENEYIQYAEEFQSESNDSYLTSTPYVTSEYGPYTLFWQRFQMSFGFSNGGEQIAEVPVDTAPEEVK